MKFSLPLRARPTISVSAPASCLEPGAYKLYEHGSFHVVSIGPKATAIDALTSRELRTIDNCGNGPAAIKLSPCRSLFSFFWLLFSGARFVGRKHWSRPTQPASTTNNLDCSRFKTAAAANRSTRSRERRSFALREDRLIRTRPAGNGHRTISFCPRYSRRTIGETSRWFWFHLAK